jgi:PPK2 family polyphosphate:nucleotide phosphotransferase
MKNTALVRVKPGKKIRLRDIATDATGEYASKEESLKPLGKLRDRLFVLQEALYAENKRSVLVVFQAMDTGGKDGAVKSIMSGINPEGVRVTSFKAPSTEELDHDFLWRIHQKVPPRGILGVWNRSHYEDVLIVRVHKMIEKSVWQRRYEDINYFERVLSDNGVTILKFFLHISKEEQKKRLQARLDTPEKTWKFNVADLKERAMWDDYQDAYDDAINACSTEYAPWMVVSADHKWARNIAIAEALVEKMEELNPKYPKADFDPKTIVID